MVINRPRSASAHEVRTEPFWLRWTLITIAILFLTIFVVLPLVVVFTEAFSRGVSAYLSALTDPEAQSAIRLTLIVAAVSVGLNLVFGVIAALGDREIRISRQGVSDHADRSSVFCQPGDLGPCVRAAVRRAGLFRHMADRA